MFYIAAVDIVNPQIEGDVINYNMLAKLALLLQKRSREGTNLLTIEILDEDGFPIRDLYKASLDETMKTSVLDWTIERKRAQVDEMGRLHRSITFDGYDGFKLRKEGGFKALPPENSRERWGLLPEHSPNERELLENLPALREYCIPVKRSVIISYAVCKTTDSWQGCPNAGPYGHRTRAIGIAIDNAIEKGDILFVNGLIDPNSSYEFEIPDDV